MRPSEDNRLNPVTSRDRHSWSGTVRTLVVVCEPFGGALPTADQPRSPEAPL